MQRISSNYCYLASLYGKPMYVKPSQAKDSQKIKIKKKTKTPRITDEGWNSQKRLSDPVEKKMKEREKKEEKTTVSSSKALFRFSSPIGSFTE